MAAPTYQSIGDHSEAIQIDFDPEVITYAELLEEFFSSHNPCRASFSVQYRSAIFPHDEAQTRAARAAALDVARMRGEPLVTDIEPFSGFTLAEDYHQKYRLRSERAVLAEFEALFPTMGELLESTAVTRANAFAGGHGKELLEQDLPRLGLTEKTAARLR